MMSGTYQTPTRMSDSSSVRSEEDQSLAPMRLCARPPQFYSAANPTTAGKTSTVITEMESMILYFLNQGALSNSSLLTSVRRIIHIVCVNNNLIEGEQWADRLITRGIQKMRIFSSKSDVHTATELYSLLSEGSYDTDTNTYSPIDYVLQCTHPVRLADFCDDKNTPTGVQPSILKRMNHFYPDVAFVFWADEIDKLCGLWKQFCPKLQKFPNVLQINGITATPYLKYWELMHDLGYGEIPLIGALPDASDYRTIRDHKLIFTDEVSIKSPVKNFEYLLTHPGEVCYIEDKPVKKKLHIPDLSVNTKSILYVPGEVTILTHTGIAKLAMDYDKNALEINGKFKGFKYADGRPHVTIKDYKDAKLKANELYVLPSGESISFKRLPYMDIAIIMYNDPSLQLKEKDLVITGFNCISRGVTFNRPDFQFDYVILSEYHYKEGSKQIEEIIQVVGRAQGNKQWVKEGITFLSPKYICDVVEEKIQEQITFLRTAPTTIQYADMYREPKGVPIKITITKTEILTKIQSFGNLTEKKRIGFMNILREGVRTGDIVVHDPNHPLETQIPFNFEQYSLSTKRILDNETKKSNYRFPEFYEHYTKRIPYGQSVKEEGIFNLDLTCIPITINSTTKLEAGTGFISFMYANVQT